jgi:hypothetical protein
MDANVSSAATSMPNELNRGYSNSFLDMLARQTVIDLPVLTIEQLNAMD